MKKNKLLICCLLSTLFMSSCGEQISSPTDNSTPSSPTSSQESSVISEETSSDDLFADFTYDETIYDFDTVTLVVGQSFSLKNTSREDLRLSWYDILVEDKTILAPDAYDNINGLKEGVTTLKVLVDEEIYDEIKVEVVSLEKYHEAFINTPLKEAELEGKTFTVFGDSISDISVTAYPDNRPEFWCEMLASQYNMTMHNYAVSGSTTGYCKGLIDRAAEFIKLVGTYKINQQEVKDAVASSDYVFIYFGNNDATYSCNIGEIGDVNDENYMTYESFKGSYSYLISKIREVNPSVKIVCMSLSPSTWGEPAYTRQHLSDMVKELADELSCKYAHIYDSWTSSEYTTCCPDGIHPQTKGYERILENLLNS